VCSYRLLELFQDVPHFRPELVVCCISSPPLDANLDRHHLRRRDRKEGGIGREERKGKERKERKEGRKEG